MYGLGMATMERPPDPDDVADDDDDNVADDVDVADGDDLADAEGPVDVLGDLGIQAGQIDASHVWPGVLLTPEALATYEELVPGAAERILKMAEQAVKSEFEVWSDADGGWAGFSIVAALVFFGLAVGGVGTRAALIAGGASTAVALLIAIFAWFRWTRLQALREERRRRDQ